MKGFTLIEMMVALLIFGLIAAAGVSVMSFTADNQEIVRGRMDRLADFQRARALLKADLSQAAARRTRDEAGRLGESAFGGGEQARGGPLLRFVRRGWDNPDAAPRASLQAVEYSLEAGKLQRRTRPALDGAPLGQPQVLYDGVQAARVSFLSGGKWAPAMPPATPDALPQAVRLDLDLTGVGEVSQLFLVTGDTR